MRAMPFERRRPGFRLGGAARVSRRLLSTLSAVLLSSPAVARVQAHTAPAETAVTDAARALFAARTPSCAACQRMVCHLDDVLLPRSFEERAKTRSSPSSGYGRFDAMVEEEVSASCSASSIQLSRDARKACERLLETREEEIVRLWFDRVTQDDEWNMNWLACSSGGAAFGGSGGDAPDSARAAAAAAAAAPCPDALASLGVPALDQLEQERKLDRLRQPASARASGEGMKYQSEPSVPATGRELGEVQALAGMDFAPRCVFDDASDALVYFASPSESPRLHAAVLRTLGQVATLMRGADAAAFVATLDTERNEVPHPYGAHVGGNPTVILYPAGGKAAPRLLPMRGTEDEEESAPTLGDVLALLHRRGGAAWTRERAGEAFVNAEQEALEGGARHGDDEF